MIELILGLFIIIVLLLIPGYLLVNFLVLRTDDRIERIFYGLILSMSLLMIFGFILSYLESLKAQYILAFIVAYFSITIILYLKSKQGFWKSLSGKGRRSGFLSFKEIFSRSSLSNMMVLLLFVIAILLCSLYSQQSPFPTGYDRGNHFGDSLFIAKNGGMPDTHPGSYYDPFYFQGPNVLISMLTISSLSISILDLNPSISDFNNYLSYGELFNLVFSLLISLGVLAVYVLGKRLYDNWKVGVFGSFFFVILIGFGIASLGSIGTNLGFLLITAFLVMLVALRKESLKAQDAALLAILVSTIFLIHIIVAAFAILLLILVFIWDAVRKRFKTKQACGNLLLIGGGIALWFLIMVFFAPNLFQGIIDEVFRKNAESLSSEPLSTNSLNFLITGLDNIVSNPLVLISLPFFFIGVVFDLKKLKSYLIPLVFASFTFALFPILPFIKTMSYIAFPVAVLAGVGFLSVIRRNRRAPIALIVCLLVITSMSISIHNLDATASRQQYYDYDGYERIFDLSEWLNEEIVSYTVVIPDSGGPAHVLNALADGKVMIAEPRYTDLPSFVECATLYIQYPTSYRNYNYSDVPAEDKYNITIKYNINIIIESPVCKVDVDKLSQYYSEIEIFNFSENLNMVILFERNEDTSNQ